MSEILTKADILKGVRSSESVEIEGLGTILLRPLTDGEYSRAQQMNIAAITAMTDIPALKKEVRSRQKKGKPTDDITLDIDVNKYTEATKESRYFVAACGMSVNEPWSVDEVKAMKPGIPDRIATAVYKITNVAPGDQAALTMFRPQQ